MLFLGTTFLGAKYTALPTPSYSKDDTMIGIQNMMCSGVEITKDISSSPTSEISDRWDWDTILMADYSTEETSAGNTSWTVENISAVAIKRRVKGTFNWQTLFYKDINTKEDFEISGYDSYNKSNTMYEYAIVPYRDGNAGMYNIEEIKSDFDGIFIVGRDKIYRTFSTNGFIDTTRNISGLTNVPKDSRYPVYFYSGNMNYDSGSVEGKFYDLDIDCQIVEDEGYFFKTGLMDFLTDQQPKILKHSDGRIWLIQVMPNPTDSADGDYRFRNIAFNWVQIGEYDNMADLYYCNLSDITEEWW